MAKVVGEYGAQHKRDELVVNMEFNLEELYDLESRYSNDGFRRDIWAAIEEVERRQKAREAAQMDVPGLRLEVVHRQYEPNVIRRV